MDNTAWLVPGLADGQIPRGSIIGVAIPIIGVAIPLSCDLVTSRTTRAGHQTAHQ